MALLLLAPAASGLAADCTGVSPVMGTSFTSVEVATGVQERPLDIASPPGDRNRLFILAQDGRIWIKKRGDSHENLTLFLDIRTRVQSQHFEMGLLGLAFDPGYATNGRFYVSYTEGPIQGPYFVVVARYSVSAGNPDSANPGSEQRLLRMQKSQTTHQAGQLIFGADGFLYVAVGDGGGGGDPHGVCGNGQNLQTLFGKFLRLDVRGVDPNSLAPDCGGVTAGYRIPSTNPFADGPGGACDEIWSYGLRNPWRSSFDALTGDMYVADVGEFCIEEINFVAGGGAGANYGWRQMEGSQCYNGITCDNPAPVDCPGVPACNDPSLTLPVFEYGHNVGCAVTGGYVYRGCLMPDLVGRYFYGDYCAAFLQSFVVDGGVMTDPQVHADYNFNISGFGVDDQGEIYFADHAGRILRILPVFTNMEVSGRGAALPFVTGRASWTWEDLEYSTMHPVASYRVYRGTPGGSFQCVYASADPVWPRGDALDPPAGEMFAYLVVAVNPSGQRTRTGSPTSVLLPDSCPPEPLGRSSRQAPRSLQER